MGFLAFQVGDPPEVDIAPGSLKVEGNTAYEAKLRRALALLGNKWCFADTRKKQIQQLQDEGADLI